jgi:hypothetical protein
MSQSIAIALLAEFLAKSEEMDATAERIRAGQMTNEEIYTFTDSVKAWNDDFLSRVRAAVQNIERNRGPATL